MVDYKRTAYFPAICWDIKTPDEYFESSSADIADPLISTIKKENLLLERQHDYILDFWFCF